MQEPTLNPETEREFDEKMIFAKFSKYDREVNGRNSEFVNWKSIKQFIAKVEQRARDEAVEDLLKPVRDKYDKETRERKNKRVADVITDKQGNIYIIALRERVIGRLVSTPPTTNERKK